MCKEHSVIAGVRLAVRYTAVGWATVGWVVLTSAYACAQPIDLRLGPSGPLSPPLYSFNTNLLTATAFQGIDYGSPLIDDAIATLRPRALRFPGGTIANNYLWASDGFSDPLNDRTRWAAEQLRLFRKIGRRYDLAGYAKLCERAGVEPIWVLNVYEESPDSVLKLIDTLDRWGLKLELLELANEPYWDGRTFNDVHRYIELCRPIAAAVKARHPRCQIGACFAPLENAANYAKIWNAPLSRETWFDAIIYHEYYGGQGIVLDPGAAIPATAMKHPEQIFDQVVREFSETMPGKPIWYTEWNAGVETLDQWKNTGAELQFITASMISIVGHRDVIEVAVYHELYNDRFGTFVVDDHKAVQRNASWELFTLIGWMFDTDHVRDVITGDDDLCGFATGHGDAMKLLLLNRSDRDIDVRLPAELGSGLGGLRIDCPPEVRYTRSQSLIRRQPIESAVFSVAANSIHLIASDDRLRAVTPSGGGAVVADDLFRGRPELSLWYEPYANWQPTFDRDGVYAIKLDSLRDKPSAVVTVGLAGLGLESGREYWFGFDAKLQGSGGLVVTLPEPDGSSASMPRSGFHPLTGDFTSQKHRFRYDLRTNQGQVTIVLTGELIKNADVVSLRDFSIRPVRP